jgi:pimeloyl-ACP methyl ester carboxylesterase
MARFLVERNWNVLTLDNRGAGQTKSGLNFSLDDSAKDVVRLWDALQIKQSALLGISYGGVIAMHVALNSPTRVQKLSLVSTAGKASDIQTSKDLSKYFSKTFAEKHAIMVSAFVKELQRNLDDVVSSGRAQAQRQAMAGFDLSAQLGNIRMPVQILHGTDDEIISIEAAKALHKKIPNAKLSEYPGLGHLLLAEMPKDLYEAVYQFVIS